jgi:hypothetical protein
MHTITTADHKKPKSRIFKSRGENNGSVAKRPRASGREVSYVDGLRPHLSPSVLYRVNTIITTVGAMPGRPHMFARIMKDCDIISTMPTVALYSKAKEVLYTMVSVKSPWQGRLANPANPPNAITYPAVIDNWRSFWIQMLEVPDDKLSFAYATPDQTFKEFLDANIVQPTFEADTSHIIRILMSMCPWDNLSTTYSSLRNRLTEHLYPKEDSPMDRNLKVKGFKGKELEFWNKLDAVLEVKLGVLAKEVCHCNPILSSDKQFISAWEHRLVDMLTGMHRAWTHNHDCVSQGFPEPRVEANLLEKIAQNLNVDLDGTGVQELITDMAEDTQHRRLMDEQFTAMLPPFLKFHVDS